MKRSQFLALAGVLAIIFGVFMIVSPDQMLANMTTITGAGASNVFRWLGAALLSVGVINLFARNDAGSDALRAVMTGNIVLHVIAWGLDFVDWRAGVVKSSGMATGSVVHALLTIGFVYYLAKMGKRTAA